MNLKSPEKELDNNDSIRIISNKKVDITSHNKDIKDEPSITIDSCDISKTCVSSENMHSTTKKYFEDLHNEKLLFDEIERKVFKKENILSRNLEESLNREYSILKMVFLIIIFR